MAEGVGVTVVCGDGTGRVDTTAGLGTVVAVALGTGVGVGVGEGAEPPQAATSRQATTPHTPSSLIGTSTLDSLAAALDQVRCCKTDLVIGCTTA